MTTLIIRNARVLTLARGPRPRRGADLADLAILDRADVEITGGRITVVRPCSGSLAADPPAPLALSGHELDAAGRVLMPAFIDPHTHACFAGSRLDEWEMKLKGATYLEILAAGGGIMSTVRAVRAADETYLTDLLRNRLRAIAGAGTGALEIKSGYGLDEATELKMLRAIRAAASPDLPHITPTALLGHALDPAQPDFVDRTINATLPAISHEFPGIAVDAYCETGAWSVRDTARLLARARELGHPVRVHADQFNALGMVDEAIRLGALSVDHLEASTTDALERLAASSTFGVMLPICGLHLDARYANAQYFVAAGGVLCLASNFNPGSAPSFSIPLVIAAAVRHMGLTVHQAIAATTINPASLLGLRDRGSIAPGQRADLLLLRTTDERSLAFMLDADPIAAHIRAGRLHLRPA